jgi:hypothetical protein
MGVPLVLALLLALPPSPPPSPATKDDTYVLMSGDRVTGQTVTKGKTSFVVQTPFGRLTLPRAKVQKVIHPDGSEEAVTAPPPAPEPSIQLLLIVSGQAFWQAWPPPPKDGEKEKQSDLDPTLRLEVRLDDEPIVVYTDSHLDPGDLPGAIVNSFSFLPGEVSMSAADGIIADTPENRPGRSVLRVHIPSSRAGAHRLGFAYRANTASAAEPHWQDLAQGSLEVVLGKNAPCEVRVEQARGRMEYAGFMGIGKKMKNVETFRVVLYPLGAAPPSPSPSPSPEP